MVFFCFDKVLDKDTKKKVKSERREGKSEVCFAQELISN